MECSIDIPHLQTGISPWAGWVVQEGVTEEVWSVGTCPGTGCVADCAELPPIPPVQRGGSQSQGGHQLTPYTVGVGRVEGTEVVIFMIISLYICDGQCVVYFTIIYIVASTSKQGRLHFKEEFLCRGDNMQR